MSAPYMDDEESLEYRMEALARYLEGSSIRAKNRIATDESDYARALDQGYSSAYKLAAKWLRDALAAQ